MKAILLGSIGVIVETSELQRQSYNEAFKYHGLDWYWSVANYCELLKKPGGLKRMNIFGGHLIDSETLLEIHKTRQTIFDSKIEHGLQPRNGIENCITYIDNFDPAKSSNPFAYFTQIIYYAFLRRIQKEKKQVDIKNKMIEKSGYSEVFTGDEYGGDSSYEQIKNSLEQKMRD